LHLLVRGSFNHNAVEAQNLPRRGNFGKYQGGGAVVAQLRLLVPPKSLRRLRECESATHEMSQEMPCSHRQETFTQQSLSGCSRQVIGAAKSGGAWRSFLVLQG